MVRSKINKAPRSTIKEGELVINDRGTMVLLVNEILGGVDNRFRGTILAHKDEPLSFANTYTYMGLGTHWKYFHGELVINQ